MSATNCETRSPILVSIEGNIGAGKSSIIRKMKEKYASNPDVVFVEEPVHIWDGICDEAGTPILKLFYENPKEHAFAFQQMAYITRITLLRKTIKENPHCKVIICERSLDADRNIFAKMLFDDGIISSVCFKIYCLMFDEFTSAYPIDRCIYIDADPEVCLERIARRSREGESGIPIDYLAKCKRYHDEWLLNTPILHLKTNENATYAADDLDDCGNKWIQQIMEFIQ